MSEVAEIGNMSAEEIAAFISKCSPDQIAVLKESLGVRKAKAKKVETPELIAARADLERFTAENADLIKEYSALQEVLKSFKGTRTVLATKQYNLDISNGVITTKDGQPVTTFKAEGWQGQMRAAEYTVGQIAAVSKKMRSDNPSFGS